MIRKKEITNWKMISDCLTDVLPPKEKPDFNSLASFTLESIKDGYAPAAKLITVLKINRLINITGLNNSATVKLFPARSLNFGNSA